MTVSLVLVACGGTRAIVRCADSAARQTMAAADVTLAIAGDSVPAGIVSSLHQRQQVLAVRDRTGSDAVNTAVARARGEAVAVVPATFRLEPRMLELCSAAIADAGTAVALPAIRIITPDATPLRTIDFDARLEAAVADPRSTPPAFVFSRAAWGALGPLDASFGELSAYEWWIRLLAVRCCTRTVGPGLLTFEAAGDAWWPPTAAESHLDGYRKVLEKHRAAIESAMHGVLVEREVMFGRLLDRHRDLVRSRDADLAELDRLRAEIAHRRAYLAHYGRDGFDWGDWRRPDPISRDWGYDRGEPVDRHYIDAFLAAHSSDIRGAVLEVQEDDLTRRFGGARVEGCDVLDLDDGNARATVVADLRAAPDIPDARFDCIILTQTLHVIDDAAAVLRECFRLLRPGGVLLATLPCASRVCLEYGEDGDFWRVTPAGARALVEPVFGAASVECTAYGSVLTNVAFLHGLGRGELTADEFAATDEYYPALVGVRARKPPASRRPALPRHSRGTVLLYHRIAESEDVHGLNVPAALFAQHLAALAECHPMPLDELLDRARDGLPEGALAVTFDDAYSEVVELAVPMLERFGVPATIFATTRWLDEPGEYWWDALERIVLDAAAPPSLPIEIDGQRITLPTATAADRRVAHDRLHRSLVHARLGDRDRLMARIAGWHRGAPARHRPSVADELRRVAGRPGITIGAHSVNHVALPDQPGEAQHREIRDSAAALERVLGKRIDLFAYPYGAVDGRSADAVRSASRWGLTCEARSIGGSFDAARVPRVEVTRRRAPDTLRALVSSPRAFG